MRWCWLWILNVLVCSLRSLFPYNSLFLNMNLILLRVLTITLLRIVITVFLKLFPVRLRHVIRDSFCDLSMIIEGILECVLHLFSHRINLLIRQLFCNLIKLRLQLIIPVVHSTLNVINPCLQCVFIIHLGICVNIVLLAQFTHV